MKEYVRLSMPAISSACMGLTHAHWAEQAHLSVSVAPQLWQCLASVACCVLWGTGCSTVGLTSAVRQSRPSEEMELKFNEPGSCSR